MVRLAFTGMVAFLFVVAGGCRPAHDVSSELANERLEQLVGNETQRSMSPIPNPAQTNSVPTNELNEPNAIVSQYLELLRQGKIADAEQFLSKVALLNFRQADMSLQSPGSQAAKYSIAKPRYATNQQKIAMVECTVTDWVDGKPETSDISWMMKREDSRWLITGMVLSLEEGSRRKLLSFENSDDVQFIKQNIFLDSDAETTNSKRVDSQN